MNKESDSRYTWGGIQFSDAEIEQIIRLVKDWASGWQYDRPLDRRRLSREVIRYGLGVGLLVARHKTSIPERIVSPLFDGRLYYKPHSNFEPYLELPPEALWRIFDRDIFQPHTEIDGRNQGYSITKSHGWGHLNIFHRRPETGSSSTYPDQTDAMIRAICRLQQYGYLIFQYGGFIWDISLKSS